MNNTMKECVFWLSFLATILVWLSLDDVNSKNKEYTKSLETVLATCLDSSAGKPLKIGDDYYLRGATKL